MIEHQDMECRKDEDETDGEVFVEDLYQFCGFEEDPIEDSESSDTLQGIS